MNVNVTAAAKHTSNVKDRAKDPTSIRVVERLYLGTITLAALFVAYLGFLAPKRMDESFTWAALPPLHARFVASLYLFGGVYLGACTLARRRAANGPVYGGITAFTGLLLLVTLLNLNAFDFDLAPVWVWTVSYIVYPIVAVVLTISVWRRGGFSEPEPVRQDDSALGSRCPAMPRRRLGHRRPVAAGRPRADGPRLAMESQQWTRSVLRRADSRNRLLRVALLEAQPLDEPAGVRARTPRARRHDTRFDGPSSCRLRGHGLERSCLVLGVRPHRGVRLRVDDRRMAATIELGEMHVMAADSVCSRATWSCGSHMLAMPVDNDCTEPVRTT